MPAKSPDKICRLFKQYMAEGDIESLLSLYDPQIAFLNQANEVKNGKSELRQELAPLAAAKAIFGFDIKQIVQSGDDRANAHQVEDFLASRNVGVCHRGRTSPARRHMGLAHR